MDRQFDVGPTDHQANAGREKSKNEIKRKKCRKERIEVFTEITKARRIQTNMNTTSYRW